MPYILEKVGDWDKALSYFDELSSDKVQRAFEEKIREDGDMLVNTIKNHISAQDLGWTPLAESTVNKKAGSMIYVETGALVDSIQAKEVSNNGDFAIQVGAEGTHPSGESSAQILEYLEYGTNKIPPRPLIRPTVTEKEKEIKSGWVDLFNELLKV